MFFHSRSLGMARPGRIYFHPDERFWLTEWYRKYKVEAEENGVKPDYTKIDWKDLVDDFNQFFSGQNLGDSKRRPVRSRISLKSERFRNREICTMAGLKYRSDRNEPRNNSDGEGGTDDEDEGEGHGEGEEDGDD